MALICNIQNCKLHVSNYHFANLQFKYQSAIYVSLYFVLSLKHVSNLSLHSFLASICLEENKAKMIFHREALHFMSIQMEIAKFRF